MYDVGYSDIKMLCDVFTNNIENIVTGIENRFNT